MERVLLWIGLELIKGGGDHLILQILWETQFIDAFWLFIRNLQIMIFLISFNLNKQITIKRKIQQKSPDPDPDRFLPENVNNFVRSKFCSLHSLVNFSLLLNNTIIQDVSCNIYSYSTICGMLLYITYTHALFVYQQCRNVLQLLTLFFQVLSCSCRKQSVSKCYV